MKKTIRLLRGFQIPVVHGEQFVQFAFFFEGFLARHFMAVRRFEKHFPCRREAFDPFVQIVEIFFFVAFGLHQGVERARRFGGRRDFVAKILARIDGAHRLAKRGRRTQK